MSLSHHLATTSSRSELNEVWDESLRTQIQQLADWQRELLFNGQLSFECVQSTVEQVATQTQEGKLFKGLSRLNKAFQRLQTFSAAVNTLTHGALQPDGLLWGCLKLLLTVSDASYACPIHVCIVVKLYCLYEF